MNSANADSRGTIVRCGEMLCINNALVEEVYTYGGRTGYLLVSYSAMGKNNMTYIEQLRLNVSRNTVVINTAGRPVPFCEIKQGEWINAEFSPAMTRSIPPATNASRITVRRREQSQIPQPPGRLTTTDRVIGTDTRNNILLTGNPDNINRQTKFIVTNETEIIDKNGNRIPLKALSRGEIVKVTHANIMTMSIPPQTTAFRIQVL